MGLLSHYSHSYHLPLRHLFAHHGIGIGLVNQFSGAAPISSHLRGHGPIPPLHPWPTGPTPIAMPSRVVVRRGVRMGMNRWYDVLNLDIRPHRPDC